MPTTRATRRSSLSSRLFTSELCRGGGADSLQVRPACRSSCTTPSPAQADSGAGARRSPSNPAVASGRSRRQANGLPARGSLSLA